MKNTYLASIDLDSTLLKDDKSLSNTTISYIQKFVNEGNYFILNTGRPFQGTKSFLKALNIHMPIVVNNGTAIVEFNDDYSKVTNYYLFSMNQQIVKDFYLEIDAYLKNTLVTTLFNDYSIDFETLPFFVKHLDESVKITNGKIFNTLNDEPIKLEIYFNKKYLDEILNILSKDKYKNEFEYIYWGTYDEEATIEISKKGVNKGYALDFLTKKFNINKKNTFSFGDQLNDIPMIKNANYGVAMISSRDEVIKEAKYVSIYDNNNDGVIMFMKEIIKE